MVYRTPKWVEKPKSLRDLLLNTKFASSLSHKFVIAQQLARSVCYVHAFGFVHKNIRPETVLVVNSDSAEITPSTYLVGFGDFRKEEGKTAKLGDETFEKNLYRHATRQGLHPETDYVMQHDIYNLGVCLLEIGLWRSFIEYQPRQQTEVNPTPVATKPSAALSIRDSTNKEESKEFLLHTGKQELVNMARTDLPRQMGSKYTEIVITCLTCLDHDSPDFGDPSDFEDEDGIRVGARYIEKVCLFITKL